MSNAVATSAAPAERSETIFGLVVSLLFWLCLVCSALLFALVGLSPKFLVYLHLRSQFDANQTRLVQLEQQSNRLQQVVEAIKQDQDFAAELTRIEFEAIRPGEEVIPVDNDLKLDARSFDKPAPKVERVVVWYLPIVQYLASDSSLRTSLLWSAAVLVVISFWFLQPGDLANSNAAGGKGVWQNLRNRYIRQGK